MNQVLSQKLGEVITEFRVKMGYTREEFAKKLGKTKAQYINIETGRRSLDVEELLRVPSNRCDRTALSSELGSV